MMKLFQQPLEKRKTMKLIPHHLLSFLITTAFLFLLLTTTPAFSTSTTEKTRHKRLEKSHHRTNTHHGSDQQIGKSTGGYYSTNDNNKYNNNHHQPATTIVDTREEYDLRKVSNENKRASIVPTFSLPSVVNLYANTPLYIPIVLTNEVTPGTTFEYNWKISNSTLGITLASGTSPTIYVGEYDLDVLKKVTYFQNSGGIISSPISSWTISVDVTSRGDYGIIIAQYKKTIPFDLYLLGVQASIVGESQDVMLITDVITGQLLNASMTFITPKIEYYDTAISKMVKSNGQCSWTCTYTLISGSMKNCTNFEQLKTFLNGNCQSFSIVGKSVEDLTSVEKFNIGINYNYSSFYKVESEKFEIFIHSMQSNDTAPVFQTISSTSSMQQYHPPNLPISLTPNFVNHNSNARVVFYWDVSGQTYLKQNITISSLNPNTKYVAKCTAYYLGNIQRFTSMTYTFITANNVTKPKFNIVTNSALSFQTRVQISGYIGESNNSPLCMTEIFAETSNGKISLTNGRYVCLQSLAQTSTDPIVFLRLPLKQVTLSDTLKVTFVVTDGISQESFSVTTSSKTSTILDYFSSQSIVKLTSSVLDSSSSVFENDRTLLSSHFLVAASLIIDFKKAAEVSNSIGIDYPTLSSSMGSYLSRICSSSASYLPLDQNLNCVEMIGKYVSISELTTTFSSTLLSQSVGSDIVTAVFYQLNQLVFNSNNGKGTLQNQVLFQKFSSEGGEAYVGLLIDLLQMASNYISQDYASVQINGVYVSINSDSITSIAYATAKIFLSSSTSTFKSSSSIISSIYLTALQSASSYTLSLSEGVTVQLPALPSSLLSGLTSSDSVILSLQLTPHNNVTDAQNSTIISSRKVQFQLIDPITNMKLELKDLAQPITLKLPIFRSTSLSNASIASSSCVFWSDSSRSWSTDGCTLKQVTTSNFYCECNHTTTFAVLTNTDTTPTNSTRTTSTPFDMVPLIVIASVTGGVILVTLGFAGIIQAFIHILKTADSAESGDLFLPAEFFPVNAKLPEKTKEQENSNEEESKEPKEPKVKKRYKDLSFGMKILECLKEFHPVLGIIFPKKYFKTIHTTRIDRLIILMDIFITISTVNVILLSVSTISANWVFVIPSLISFGCSTINLIPITLLFCKKQAIWKVCAYGYSCVFAFICLVIAILASAGVFVSQKWNMNILNWLYATILGVVWDLIVFRVVLASVIAFLIEVKVTIDMGIAAFKKSHNANEVEAPLPTRRMVTVQNNVRIPMLFAQKEKPNIPKLNLRAVEGVATPKENPVNELSSLHASPTASDATSSSSGVDSYFSPHKEEVNQPTAKETFVNIEESKTSSSAARSSDHSTSKEGEQQCISPGCIILDSPGLSPISPLVSKHDHDMSFVEKVQLRDELLGENLLPVIDEKIDNTLIVVEEQPVIENEAIEPVVELEIKETEHDVKTEELELRTTEPLELIEQTPVQLPEEPPQESPQEEKQEEKVVEETPAEPPQEIDQVVAVHVDDELPTEIILKKNPITILKEILKEKEVHPEETKTQEPKEKSEKNILEYIEQVSEHENSITLEQLNAFSSEILERLPGKTISEILLILSEASEQPSTQPMYSSPLRTNSPVARNALQKNNPGNKSARMLKSGGIEIDRTRKRSLSFNKLYGIEESMIKPQTDFFDHLRLFVVQNYSGEAKVKVLNELLFLQCIYLHYKIISVTPDTRKEMAEQVVTTFLNENEKYHINIGFYKRVLSSCIVDENLNANTFERACEIIEIALKPVINNFLKHAQSNTMTSV